MLSIHPPFASPPSVKGILLFEGTEDLAVEDSLFTRIDGNAVFLSGYNRRTSIQRNEFALLGQNAIARSPPTITTTTNNKKN